MVAFLNFNFLFFILFFSYLFFFHPHFSFSFFSSFFLLHMRILSLISIFTFHFSFLLYHFVYSKTFKKLSLSHKQRSSADDKGQRGQPFKLAFTHAYPLLVLLPPLLVLLPTNAQMGQLCSFLFIFSNLISFKIVI